MIKRDVLYVAIWLAGLALLNLKLEEPIRFFLPYAVPIVYLGWRHGFSWGLLTAACALGVLVIGETIPSMDNPPEHLFGEQYFVFFQLATIAVSTTLIKKAMIRRDKLRRNRGAK